MDFWVSMQGIALIIILRLVLSAVFLCLGVQLFDFKNLTGFFSFKRISSVFFLLMAIRIFYGALGFSWVLEKKLSLPVFDAIESQIKEEMK